MTKILKATSGRLFGRVTSGTGRAEELTPTQVRTLIDFDESVDDRVSALLAAGTNITITYNDASNTLTIASTAGGLSGTGSVDNAVLRADGTGGATLQASAIVIDDLFTASPNNTVNFTCLKPTGGTTNVGVAVVPKGTGAFTLAVPDGTSTGGNARGPNAIDLQTLRTAAGQVAGDSSVCIGIRNSAVSYGVAIGQVCDSTGAYGVSIGGSCSTNSNSVAIGNTCTAANSGNTGVAIGMSCTASGDKSVAIGNSCTASSFHSAAIGRANTASNWNTLATGWGALSDRQSQRSHASGFFAATGDAQLAEFVLRNKTTNSTPTTLFADGSSVRLAIPSGKVLSAVCRICGIKSDGSAAANYVRRVVIKNVAGTTSLVGAVETLGTDIEDNASTDVAITADNTNDALQINVTGITGETWRWVAVVEGLEISYGT